MDRIEKLKQILADDKSSLPNLHNIDLSGSDLHGIDLSNYDLSGANLTGANLSDADLSGAILTGANISKSNLSDANLSKSILKNTNFTDSKLIDTILSYSDLFRADLSRADLSGAQLSESNLSECNLSGANLTDTNFIRAILYGANLSNAIFFRANLTNANLSKTDLTNANMIGAKFYATDLTEADLTRANLSEVSLSQTNLTRANLSFANTKNTDFNTAILLDANLDGIIIPSLSLDKMISDMQIRKLNKMLYMPYPENHPIDPIKIDQWINSQCNPIARELAQLFKKYTNYISWEHFYDKCMIVFEKLYDKIKDSSYCLFTKASFSNANFNEKSNYWMIQLLLDYYLAKGYLNLPKELIICTEHKNGSLCLTGDYQYYIALDDVIYSGGQMFSDAILTKNISPEKIIVAAPFISEYSLNRFLGLKGYTYTDLIYAEIMNYWWKDKIVLIEPNRYNLKYKSDRIQIFDLLLKYFPSPRKDAVYADHNFMYYFDHKIADYASSFPTVYHLGIITPDIDFNIDEKNPESNDTYDDTGNSSKICHKFTYLPFIKNCINKNPVFDNVTNESSKISPDKLCVEPWYKKKFHASHILESSLLKYITSKKDYLELIRDKI